MYQLYYLPGSSSLATHVLLNELHQPFQLIERPEASVYTKINPANRVPALVDNGTVVLEGAAIALHLMEKHGGPLLPKDAKARSQRIQWMMFANASVYPAYLKLFFADGKDGGEENREAAIEGVNEYWRIAGAQLAKTRFLAGDTISMADIMLTVYANWNKNFGDRIVLGDHAKRLIREVSARESFQKAIAAEKIQYAA